MLHLLALFLVLILELSPAYARPLSVVILNPQVVGLPGTTIYDDLTKGGGGNDIVGGICSERGHQIPCLRHYSVTRASVKYCQTVAGIWISAVSGQQCLTNQGNEIEEARTNDGLWARDLTQSGTWIAVGMGTALNAVGIDGTANSATTLTATGTASSCTASCTILQTITLGSQADNYSVWLKRVTGSGTVNITINNLAGSTACTLSTTAFTRCTVTATLANPVFGIQLTVLNDVVIADFNQLEPGSFPTSPILTTSATATRAADNTSFSGAANTILALGVGSAMLQTGSVLGSIATRYMIGGDSNNSPLRAGSGTTINARSGAATITATLGASANFTTTAAVKVAASWDASNASVVGQNGTLATAAATYVATATNTLGSLTNASYPDYVTAVVALWNNYRVPDTTLKSYTCSTALAC